MYQSICFFFVLLAFALLQLEVSKIICVEVASIADGGQYPQGCEKVVGCLVLVADHTDHMASGEDNMVDDHVHSGSPELPILHDEPLYCTVLVSEPFRSTHPILLFDLLGESNL